MKIKTFIQLIILGAICSGFGYHIMWGPKGVTEFMKAKQEVDAQRELVVKLQDEVKVLEAKLHAFNTNDFEREKVAREDLHMGFTHELVYILPKKA